MVPFALLVWLPVAYSIHILVPSNTTVNVSTSVLVIFENWDTPTDIFLKEFEVDNNEFDESVLFPVAFSTSTVISNITFSNIQDYVVVAVANPEDWNLTNALARSLEIQVLDDDDDEDRWGRHGRHRGDHDFTNGITTSVPQASPSTTASLDTGDSDHGSDHRGRRSSNHLNTAVIIGLIFGVSAFWVILGLLVYYLVRRRNASHSTERQRDDKNTTPFDLRTSHPFDDNDQEAQLSRGKRTWREAMALGRHPFRSPSNDTTHTIYTDSRSRFFVGRPNRLPPENSSESHTSHGSSAQMRSPQTKISHRDSRCDATAAIEVVQVPVDVHHPFRFADPFPPDYVSVQTIERDDFDERIVPRRTL